MAWEAFVTLRGTSEDVAVVSCVWNGGEADEFTYDAGARKISTAEKVKIVSEAKAALAAHVLKAGRETTLSGVVTTALNA